MSAFDPAVFSRNSRFEIDHLSIASIPASDLIAEFGSPLFVVDEADFRSRAAHWKSALEAAFGDRAGSVYYAAKSFISKEVARWVEQVGIGLDVCTGGELAVAQASGFPASRIELHGNNKSEDEIRQAITYGVHTIVVLVVVVVPSSLSSSLSSFLLLLVLLLLLSSLLLMLLL